MLFTGFCVRVGVPEHRQKRIDRNHNPGQEAHAATIHIKYERATCVPFIWDGQLDLVAISGVSMDFNMTVGSLKWHQQARKLLIILLFCDFDPFIGDGLTCFQIDRKTI